jgi:hypothetical protein
MPYMRLADIISITNCQRVSVITSSRDNAVVHNGKNDKLAPILIIAASAASIAATVILGFYGVYFFFFFLPISFGLPWSIKKLWRSRAKRQWNVEDLR